MPQIQDLREIVKLYYQSDRTRKKGNFSQIKAIVENAVKRTDGNTTNSTQYFNALK